jgi:hypothetical protein
VSGYLQRLVASAKKPESGVHPVVAPMFSAPDPGLEEQSFLPSEKSAPSANASPESAPPATDAQPSGSRPRTSELSAGAPPTPVAEEQSSTSSPVTEGLPPRDEGAARNRQPKQRTRLAVRGQTSVVHTEYTPLLHTISGPAPASLADVSAIRARTTLPPARADNDGSRDRTVSPSKPDEIQITIGRIEVAAVPETRPRSTVKPDRKRSSLDDYLKRADTRRR